MWYAIRYAYGSTVGNDGNRAGTVYQFTRRALRDTWVADGPADSTASGYRANARARYPQVRKALTEAYDGDAEAWHILARQRVEGSQALSAHRDTILYDWPEGDHAQWVATAPEREIIDWARGIAQSI